MTCDLTSSRPAQPTRRAVLTAGAALLGTRLLPAAAAMQAGTEPVLVLVNLVGGNDGLNTVIPRGLPGYAAARPRIGIPPARVLPLDRGPAATTACGLHPALARLTDVWTAGELAIVQKVGMPNPTFSHFESRDAWSLGRAGGGVGTGTGEGPGWIARYKDRFARPLTGAAGIGTGQIRDFQGGETEALLVDSVADYEPVEIDPRYPTNSRLRDQTVFEVIAGRQETDPLQARVTAAQRSGWELVERLRAARGQSAGAGFPDTALGRALGETAILLEIGLGTRVVYAAYADDYDTHSDQLARHQVLLDELDRALSAFRSATMALGHWQRVVVAVISEFGRTVRDNGSGGTDHGDGNVVMVLGGAVRGGLYGDPVTGEDLAGRDLRWTTDFRRVYWEILERHLRCDPVAVFPERPARTDPLGFLV
jgi:uncharacterized protein (DUF1501 family)